MLQDPGITQWISYVNVLFYSGYFKGKDYKQRASTVRRKVTSLQFCVVKKEKVGRL